MHKQSQWALVMGCMLLLQWLPVCAVDVGWHSDIDDESALVQAAQQGDTVRVQQLLRSQAVDMNEGGQALMAAAFAGYLDIVRLLLQYGVSVDAAGPRGKTALMYAAQEGHLAIVRTLLHAGADPNLRALQGWNALMFASYYKHMDVVDELINWNVHAMRPEDNKKVARTWPKAWQYVHTGLNGRKKAVQDACEQANLPQELEQIILQLDGYPNGMGGAAHE